jgi:hypothetical protein
MWYSEGTSKREEDEMTATITNLIDHLQEQGYEPDGEEHIPHSDWYDLIVSGIGSVRVCIHPDDDYRTDVYLFDGHMGLEWKAVLSGAPDAAIIATVEAAEWQLAAKRGGPVTPAQEEAAR